MHRKMWAIVLTCFLKTHLWRKPDFCAENSEGNATYFRERPVQPAAGGITAAFASLSPSPDHRISCANGRLTSLLYDVTFAVGACLWWLVNGPTPRYTPSHINTRPQSICHSLTCQRVKGAGPAQRVKGAGASTGECRCVLPHALCLHYNSRFKAATPHIPRRDATFTPLFVAAPAFGRNPGLSRRRLLLRHGMAEKARCNPKRLLACGGLKKGGSLLQGWFWLRTAVCCRRGTVGSRKLWRARGVGVQTINCVRRRHSLLFSKDRQGHFHFASCSSRMDAKLTSKFSKA